MINTLNLNFRVAFWKLAVVLCSWCLSSNGLLAQPNAELEQQVIRQAIEQVSPSIVQLQIIGGAERIDDVSLASGPATGLIVSPDGYVVTSLYRFDPRPATVVAILGDGKQFASSIVAIDHSRKLVLLKLQDAEGLPVADAAPADSIRVGQRTIALGKTYRPDRPNVSTGIVSATDRIFGRAMQTDADISPANYGGPLVDLDGRVLGILSPMSPSSEKSIGGVEWYDSGIGFAIPLATWMGSLDRLKAGTDLEVGYLGVGLADGTPRETSAGLKTVVLGGPAAEAGLEANDVITAIDSVEIVTQVDLKFAVMPHYAGDKITVTYLRGEEKRTTEATLSTIAALQSAADAAAPAKEAAPAEEKADE